jgi:TPR repeat protein/serine/threonine protein kinase
MDCGSCAKGNLAANGLRICVECGAPLGLPCPECGWRNHAADTTCRGCKSTLEQDEVLDGSAHRIRHPQSFAEGRYVVTRLLSISGPRRLFLAEDTRLDRQVSVAMVAECGPGDIARAQVMRVARALARLSGHPHIVGVYEAGCEDGFPFIVSEYIGARSLEDLLAASPDRRLAIAEALQIGAEVCAALDYAHQLGVTHGGLNPAAVFMAPGGSWRLGEYGLGLPLAINLAHESGESVPIGPAAYLAPEQILGRSAEPRSDLYSLGALLYEMLAGRPPFIEDELGNPLTQRLSLKPLSLWRVRPETPAGLQALVTALLRRRIDKRPASAAVVLEQLKRELDGQELHRIVTTAPARALTTESVAAAAAVPEFEVPTPADEQAGRTSARRPRARKPQSGRKRNPALAVIPLAAGIVMVVAVHALISLLTPGAPSHLMSKVPLNIRPVVTPQAAGPKIDRPGAIGQLTSADRPHDISAPSDNSAAGAREQAAKMAHPAGQQDHPQGHPDVTNPDSAETGADSKPQRFRDLFELATDGSTDAQSALGIMYLHGDGTAKDYVQALHWLNAAAARNNADAQANLGFMYATGEGVTQDYALAAKWFVSAANHDHPEAQYDLALMYDQGQGVPIDREQALKWLRKSAARENVHAEYELGRRYLTGQGVGQSYAQAIQWLRKAAEQGDDQAQNALGFVYEERRSGFQNFAEAVQWYRKAAEQGSAKAQLNLGIMYENAEGVPRNYPEAARWYRQAAAQNDAYAQTSLGVIYCRGEGVPRDYAKAMEWFLRAASQGEPKAEYNLGIMYDTGLGVPKDFTEAARWYRRAAAQGHVDAQYNLGYLYEHGQGVARNSTEALEWYRKAAGQGDSSALERMKTLESK